MDWWRSRREDSRFTGGPARELRTFGLVTLACSIPFWLAARQGSTLPAPFSPIPLSAASVLVPAATALGVSVAHGRAHELRSQWRTTGIRSCDWIAAVCVFGLPTLIDAALRHDTWPMPSAGRLAVESLVYLAAAGAEETGWSAFAGPRLLRLTGSVPATMAVSSAYWAVWHLIPFAQTGHGWEWTLGQSLQAVLLRTAIVGLCARTGRWGWLAVAAHTATNLAWALSPVGYRPWVTDLVAVPGVATIALLATRSRRPR